MAIASQRKKYMTLSESDKQTIKQELKTLYPERQDQIDSAVVEPERSLPPETFKMSLGIRIRNFACELVCKGTLLVFSVVAVFVSPVESTSLPYYVPTTPALVQTAQHNFTNYYNLPVERREAPVFRPDEEQTPLTVPTPLPIYTAITGSAPIAGTGSSLTMPLYVSGLAPNDYRLNG